MLDGIGGFFEDSGPQLVSVKDIYLSAFTRKDVEEVTEFLKSRLDLTTKQAGA
jgi:hypothetical protein